MFGSNVMLWNDFSYNKKNMILSFSAGRPMGLPPSYPPPPIPAAIPTRQDTSSNLKKGQPPFSLPPHRAPTSALPKKPPPLHPPTAGSLPPPPCALHRPKSPSYLPPPVPSTPKKSLQNWPVLNPGGTQLLAPNCVPHKPSVPTPQPAILGGSLQTGNHSAPTPPSPSAKPPVPKPATPIKLVKIRKNTLSLVPLFKTERSVPNPVLHRD